MPDMHTINTHIGFTLDEVDGPMSEAAKQATLAWKEADKRALECEMLVSAARYAFLKGEGPGPTEIQVAEARMLRKLADMKLKEAIESMDSKRKQLPPRGGVG